MKFVVPVVIVLSLITLVTLRLNTREKQDLNLPPNPFAEEGEGEVKSNTDPVDPDISEDLNIGAGTGNKKKPKSYSDGELHLQAENSSELGEEPNNMENAKGEVDLNLGGLEL